MTALTATDADFLVVGLILGAVLMLVGRGIVWLVSSLWAERQARKAEAIVSSPAPVRHSVENWELIVCGHLGGRPRPTGLDYCCTRHVGHGGPHQALGADDRLIATWSEGELDADPARLQALHLVRAMDKVAPVVRIPSQRRSGLWEE